MRPLHTTRRIVLLDELRGLSVLLMVIYHGLYDLVFLFGLNFPFFSWPMRYLQLYICSSFILISGICSRLSRNNVKRGLVVLAIALAMTVITRLFMPSQQILFGILHFLGIAMIIHGVFLNHPRKLLPNFWGALLHFALFAFTWGVSSGFVGFFGLIRLPLPSFLYQLPFLFPLGFPSAGFFSSDYFPLLPWIFLFFAGSYIGNTLRTDTLPLYFYRSHTAFLAFVGRHSLLIYVLHQPLLYGIMVALATLVRNL